MTVYEKLKSIYEQIREKTDFVPDVALVLGSGLGKFGDEVEIEKIVNYSELEGFPVSTAPSHVGRFLFGRVNGVKVAVMQGRVHLYEGYTPQDVVLPVRLLGMMGAKVLFLTNAAGGADFTMNPGDLMLIRDQISVFAPSPLMGPNIDELGVRFPDMSCIYDRELCDIIRSTAARLAVPLKEGIYCQLTGPQYESPAEVRMCRALGANALGMSTAIEAIAARHMGMKVCGISCISNLACGMTNKPLTSEEVTETAEKVSREFTALVAASIGKMAI